MAPVEGSGWTPACTARVPLPMGVEEDEFFMRRDLTFKGRMQATCGHHLNENGYFASR